jgi:hypothetical protein
VLMSMLPHKDFINKDMRYLFWDPKWKYNTIPYCLSPLGSISGHMICIKIQQQKLI